MDYNLIREAARVIRDSGFTTAYTGAGISVESGIPPFRGENGLWSKYDPSSLEFGFFIQNPAESWKVIREIFYDFFGTCRFNEAHAILAKMEQKNLIHRIITQNIDNLHQEAGSKKVYEFHGNSKQLICLTCESVYKHGEVNLDHLPPTCKQCGGLLKPDFVFFGEMIPSIPMNMAYESARISDVFLIIGTTGEVMPANQFPIIAKDNGATIIEVNPERSNYTPRITDIFLQGKATDVMKALWAELLTPSLDNN